MRAVIFPLRTEWEVPLCVTQRHVCGIHWNRKSFLTAQHLIRVVVDGKIPEGTTRLGRNKTAVDVVTHNRHEDLNAAEGSN